MCFMVIQFFVIGLIVGSFLNVCVDRLPVKKSLFFPSSHCDNCHKNLSFYELIPVLSYLYLRGRCRVCRSSISPRILLLEILCGSIFSVIYIKYGFCADALFMCVTISLFLVIIFIDIEHMLVLNNIIFLSFLFFLTVLILNASFSHTDFFTHYHLNYLPRLDLALLSSFFSAFCFCLLACLYSRGLGMGDVKLVGLIGLITGYPLILVALLSGALIALIVSLLLILFGKKTIHDKIPLGAFLAMGTIITLLWGGDMLPLLL